MAVFVFNQGYSFQILFEEFCGWVAAKKIPIGSDIVPPNLNPVFYKSLHLFESLNLSATIRLSIFLLLSPNFAIDYVLPTLSFINRNGDFNFVLSCDRPPERVPELLAPYPASGAHNMKRTICCSSCV